MENKHNKDPKKVYIQGKYSDGPDGKWFKDMLNRQGKNATPVSTTMGAINPDSESPGDFVDVFTFPDDDNYVDTVIKANKGGRTKHVHRSIDDIEHECVTEMDDAIERIGLKDALSRIVR